MVLSEESQREEMRVENGHQIVDDSRQAKPDLPFQLAQLGEHARVVPTLTGRQNHAVLGERDPLIPGWPHMKSMLQHPTHAPRRLARNQVANGKGQAVESLMRGRQPATADSCVPAFEVPAHLLELDGREAPLDTIKDEEADIRSVSVAAGQIEHGLLNAGKRAAPRR